MENFSAMILYKFFCNDLISSKINFFVLHSMFDFSVSDFNNICSDNFYLSLIFSYFNSHTENIKILNNSKLEKIKI